MYLLTLDTVMISLWTTCDASNKTCPCLNTFTDSVFIILSLGLKALVVGHGIANTRSYDHRPLPLTASSSLKISFSCLSSVTIAYGHKDTPA